VPYGTVVQRDAAIAAALAAYYSAAQTDSAIAVALATIDLTPYFGPSPRCRRLSQRRWCQ